MQTGMSECDFGGPNDYNYIKSGVVGVSDPITAAISRLDREEEMTTATLINIAGVQYFYVALTSKFSGSRIIKVTGPNIWI